MGSTISDSGAEAHLPYWNVNVPADQHTAECPDFLRGLPAKDERIIGTPDADYRVASWAEVRAIAADNRLDAFQRSPAELRRYRAYSWQLKQRYGSPVNFVLQERLRWDGPDGLVPRNPEPFADPADLTVLCNDWPYGIDDRIVHLVVWVKFALAEDPATGDLTDDARARIQRYVDATFGELPGENYIWFKNWASLKSVRAVEHFHVMVFDAPPGFIDRITGGDVPLSKRLAETGAV